MNCVEKMDKIEKVLMTGHHSFPVLNKNGYCVGIIPRNFIITLLLNRAFYVKEDEGNSSDSGSEDGKGSFDKKLTSINYSK